MEDLDEDQDYKEEISKSIIGLNLDCGFTLNKVIGAGNVGTTI